jgi:hypothetical protein
MTKVLADQRETLYHKRMLSCLVSRFHFFV